MYFPHRGFSLTSNDFQNISEEDASSPAVASSRCVLSLLLAKAGGWNDKGGGRNDMSLYFIVPHNATFIDIYIECTKSIVPTNDAMHDLRLLLTIKWQYLEGMATSKDWYAWNQSIDIVWVGRIYFRSLNTTRFCFFGGASPRLPKIGRLAASWGIGLLVGAFAVRCSGHVLTHYTLHLCRMK